MLPDAATHRAALVDLRDRIVAAAADDPRLVGVAIGGSWRSGRIDAFSDLDVVLVVAEDAVESIMGQRLAFAERLGGLLVGFTGEHVGEPRLVICLYGPDPLLHCDLKFVTPSQLAQRVEDPAVEWERDDRVRAGLAAGTAAYPQPDRQWLEDRFWVWLHYAATKLGRGELLEVHDVLAAFRSIVLGPLALLAAGLEPNGLRRIEHDAPEEARRIAGTVAAYDAADCARALGVAADVYRSLRRDVQERSAAEQAALAYLEDVEAAIS